MLFSVSNQTRHAMAFAIGTFVLSACSGSGGAQAPVDGGSPQTDTMQASPSNPLGTDSVDDMDATDVAVNEPVTPSVDSPVINVEPIDNGVSEPDTNTPNDNVPEPPVEPANETPNQSPDTVQQDPINPVSTVVDFEITVPAHVSEQLQLEMTWGSKEIATRWVGDELWAASDTFPTNARLPLTITFTDVNGDIVLAEYAQDFQTGASDYQIYKISAEQFNTEQWDDDGDGVSNLKESVAGTNPLIIETEQLEVRDVYFDSDPVLANVDKYEAYMVELPYSEQSEEETNRPWIGDNASYVSRRVSIDFDENGTGSYSVFNRNIDTGADTTTIENTATRTNTGESITYEATWERYNSGAAVGSAWGIVSETRALDAQTRTQTAELFFSESGTSNRGRADIDYTLTGTLANETSACIANYGVLTYQFDGPNRTTNDLLTTVTKGVDDQYWNVVTTTSNGSVVDEYLVQGLGRDFYCRMQGL